MTENPPHKTLRERDGDVANNWYVICLTRELHKTPVSRVLYDRPYVIFRDKNGKAACLPDRCIHRHTMLSEGEVRNGEVVCPYHGWTFNSEGQVTHIPSEGKDTVPERKLCLKPIPCVEQDGAVWVWMGVDEAPRTEIPPWNFPHYGEKGWRHYFMITDFNNEVTNLAENFMDVPHTIFVHKGWFRDEANKKNPMMVDTKDATVLVTYEQEQDEFSFFARMILNPGGKKMVHTDKYIYPNLTRVDYTFGNNGFVINSQMSPVGSLNSRVYTYIAYKVPWLFGLVAEPFVKYYTRQVIEQDVVIMRNQGKSLEYDPKTTYQSTDADEVHKSIERIRYYGVKKDQKLLTFSDSKKVEFWI